MTASSPTTAGTFAILRAIETAVVSASGAVLSARTISHSFMTLAGEKKCRPTTSCGRDVEAAISSTFRVEVFVASTAAVRGRLIAAESSSIWYSNNFDAGDAAISIGARTNIQDNTVILCSTPQGVSIGRDSTVGHNVTLHDCAIGNGSLIGIGSVVARGTVVEDRVLLASDYPHFDSEYPGTVHELKERTDISDKQKQKILSENAREFLRI